MIIRLNLIWIATKCIDIRFNPRNRQLVIEYSIVAMQIIWPSASCEKTKDTLIVIFKMTIVINR